jgi:hypothetical protein
MVELMTTAHSCEPCMVARNVKREALMQVIIPRYGEQSAALMCTGISTGPVLSLEQCICGVACCIATTGYLNNLWLSIRCLRQMLCKLQSHAA